MRHFLDIPDLSADEISQLLSEAARLKAARRIRRSDEAPLRGRVVGMVFEKPSLRTRVSFESAVAQLGGTCLFLPGNEVGLGWRESHEDFARVIGQYVDALVLRVFKHETAVQVAALVPAHPGVSAGDLCVHGAYMNVRGPLAAMSERASDLQLHL